MKILDKYLIRQFLQTIIFALLGFIMIFIIVDMMENLDDFLDQHVVKMIIVEYYLVFIPEIVRLLLPVSLLFGGLFTIGKMSNLNETTAIKAGGISMYRSMLPLVLTTIIICCGDIYFSGYLVPKANKSKTQIERKYLNKNRENSETNIFFQDTKTRIVSIGYFNEEINQATKVGVQEFDANDITKLNMRLDAASMHYDSTARQWILINGTRRVFSLTSDQVTRFASMPLRDMHFKPHDLIVKQQKPGEMNITELKETIANQSQAGNDPRVWQIEYYSRISFSLTGIIIVLFGLPFSTNRGRGGLAIQIGVNILITFIYLVLYKVVVAFGTNGSLNPILTAWLVNAGFFVAAVINLFRVRQ
jgi:lipopolysaccharide export system permease protein